MHFFPALTAFACPVPAAAYCVHGNKPSVSSASPSWPIPPLSAPAAVDGVVGGGLASVAPRLIRRTLFPAAIPQIPFVEHRLLGKGKANRQKSSIHAGLRRDGSQKLTSQKTDYCTITYRF